jgi:hypothetical protein
MTVEPPTLGYEFNYTGQGPAGAAADAAEPPFVNSRSPQPGRYAPSQTRRCRERIGSGLTASMKASTDHAGRALTACPQVLIESLQLASYLAFPNAQISEFAVCQCVTEALVLQQEYGDLGGTEG